MTKRMVCVFFAVVMTRIRILRAHQEKKAHLKYYNENAIKFLQDYGSYYHLFDSFLTSSDNTSILHKYQLISPTQATLPISSNYKIRNHNDYQGLEASCDQFRTWNDSYHDLTAGHTNAYNNKFRYGEKPHDRFTSIFFQGDPWNNSESSVHFVGNDNDLLGSRLFCQFLHPIRWETAVTILGNFPNQFGGNLHKQNMVFCDIPTQISDELTNDVLAVHLNLVLGDAERTILLRNVRIPRPHELEMRSFNISNTVICNDVSDPMTIEWLIYNILMGVQHFYIYDQSASYADYSSSAIAPFLDANIVTLIHYKFSALFEDGGYSAKNHFSANGVQSTTFSVTLERFGHLNNWLTFHDMDEFFVPPVDIFDIMDSYWNSSDRYSIEEGSNTYGGNLFNTYLKAVGAEWEIVPAVVLDTLEMGCADCDNYYMSPVKSSRVAVSTHCNIAGMYFNELTAGHGKVIIKPKLVKHLNTPHHFGDYNTMFGSSGMRLNGWFRHFDQFKYSIASHSADSYERRIDDSLRDFTLLLFTRFGIAKLV